jgi:hypothetical protein
MSEQTKTGVEGGDLTAGAHGGWPVVGPASVSPRMVRTEVRRSMGMWLFPFMVAVLVWMIAGSGFWIEGLLWGGAAMLIRDTLILFGPLAGGLAAWTAGRERRRGTEELLSTTSRPAAARDLAAWTGIVAWCGLAYLSVAAGFLFYTCLNTTWGSPVLGPITVGLAALFAHSAIGYAAGNYWPSRFVAPLVAIALYWAQAVPQFLGYKMVPSPGGGWMYLSTSVIHLSPVVGDSEYSAFYGVLPNVALPQSLWMLGLAGLALASVVLHRRRDLLSWVALSVAVAVAVVGVTMLMQTPAQVTDAQRRAALIPHELVCVEGRITVCAHPAEQASLEEDAALINRVAAPLARIPGVPTRAEQKPEYRHPKPDGTLPYQPFHPTTSRDDRMLYVALDLVRDPYRTVSREEPMVDDSQAVVAGWLLQEAGVDLDAPMFVNLAEREPRRPVGSPGRSRGRCSA